ncbi:uncharacterized protein RJT20DRAFT_131401 [Scheffersomyces xylosifermentans]|uniref:uncharacterized protein n=1 Tax=Scheffersomyces xylosifermentans TaxID=1304137 RepID=UPI00315DFB0E
MSSDTLRSPPPSVSTNLSKQSKEDLVKRDIFGRTILHLLILSSRYDLLKNLLKNPDVKCVLSLTDYENGWNCLHYTIFHKRLSCFKILIEYFKNTSAKQNSLIANNTVLYELLRCKDRNGATPIQLLDNDFKDLIWIPEYINEKNEYHIAYRYKSTVASEGKDNSESLQNTEITEGDRTTPTTGNVETSSPAIVTTETKRPAIRSPTCSWSQKRGGSEVYMLGSNNNNQLGLGDSTNRSVPSKLSHANFKVTTGETTKLQEILTKPRYRQVALSKNHSIILTKDGELFSCGIGSRGRLGHGFEDMNNYYRFKRVDFFAGDDQEDCKTLRDVAISNNHSLALTTDNEVYSWGLNSFRQLGYESSNNTAKYNQTKGFLETFEATPTLVLGDLRKNSGHIIGISVSKVHSVAYTKNDLFFWGLNVGQMGIPANDSNIEVKLHDNVFRGEIQPTPRMVSLKDEIKCIATSELCTWLVTTKNDIHFYYNYQHLKLPKIPVKASSDKHFDIFKPTKLTQAVEIKKIVSKNHESCTLLLGNGSVMTCTVNVKDVRNTKYTSLWKAYDRDMVVTDIDVSNDGSIVLCTRNGSVFVKSSHSNQRKNSMTETALPIGITKNKFKKIDHLNKVVQVCCDFNFLSFGFIRDDIDTFPLKLQKNDFLRDIRYLSCLNESDFSRKQEQLLKVNHKYHTYISNFLYPSDIPEVENDEDDDTTLVEETRDSIEDILSTGYNDKYDRNKNKRQRLENTLDLVLDSEDQSMADNVKMECGVLAREFSARAFEESNKGYDCKITFEHHKDVIFGFHKKIFEVRSKVFEKVLNPTSDDEMFVSDEFVARYHDVGSTFHIMADFEIESILLMIYSIYTSKKLDLWSCYSSRHSYPPHLKKIFDEYNQLISMFRISDSIKSSRGYDSLLKNFQSMKDNSGDITIRLKDTEMKCHSYLLKARSAFFETVLSPRWETDTSSILDFGGLSSRQFEIILRHIYGYSDDELFDCFDYSFNESDEFVNDLLELIEISDELLLFQLKALCQLAISDFISLDNVILLLVHADYLSAPKLFMNCCWYIYNNLETLLFDSSFKELSFEILEKLEDQIKYFRNCKSINFANEKGELNPETLTNIFENRSNQLLGMFSNDVASFNEFFVSDRKGYCAFEPLIDVKYEVKKPQKEVPSKKKKSRKSSTLVADISDFRNNITAKEKENIDGQVVVDEENSFEIVQKRTRQRSKVNESSPSPTPPNSTPSSRNSSVVNVAQIPTKPINVPAPPKNNVLSGLSPYSNWASRPSSGSPILTDRFQQPALGKSSEAISNGEWAKRPVKAKIGPVMKLSQKERKKLAAAAAAQSNDNLYPKESLATSPVNPWLSSEAAPVPVQDTSKDLPVLGSSNKQEKAKPTKIKSKTVPSKSQGHGPSPPANPPGVSMPISGSTGFVPFASALSPFSGITSSSPFNNVYSTPSLTEVMIEESLRIERAKMQEAERKTLLEVQKEQEFAKWWEEESLRVQKQMSGNKEDKVDQRKKLDKVPKSRKSSGSGSSRRKSEGSSNKGQGSGSSRANPKRSDSQNKENKNSSSSSSSNNTNNNNNNKNNKKKADKEKNLREEQLAC